MYPIRLIGILLSVLSFAAYSASYTSCAYQLTGYDPVDIRKIEDSSNTLWVIDYSRFEGAKWTPTQVERFKANNNTVLAYISVGEAEDYRYYWKSLNKDLIIGEEGGVSGEWERNYAVKYWDSSWQNIFLKDSSVAGAKSYIKQIVEQGFNGVFIDRADVYELYREQGEQVYKQRAQQMADFVVAISKYGKSLSPNFEVYIQNSTSLVYALEKPDTLFKNIEGISLEELYFQLNSRGERHYKPDKWVREEVREIMKTYNLSVISVEYILEKPRYFKRYQKAAKKDKIYPFVSNLELDGDYRIFKKRF